MQSIHFNTIPVRNPLTERGIATVDLSRVNTLLNPLGKTPCRGWFLLLSTHLDSIDLNGLHSVTYNDDRWGEVKARNLVIAREPVKVHYTMNTGESLSCFLVEVTDRRGQLSNPIFQQAVNKLYNVREPGYGASYYTATTNGGTAWTWAELIQDLWEAMPLLGTFPGLPVTPAGTPEGWIFQGVSAWESLCMILEHAGCAVACDLTLETDQYSIVEVGTADATIDSLIAELEADHRKLHDAEFKTVARGRIPYGVRVFFHTIRGDSATVPWLVNSVYTVDIVGPDSATAEPGLYHPVWSDTPAIYDASSTLTNAAALATIAQEQADEYFANIRGAGGTRLHRIYDGAADIHPTGTIKGVSWKQNPLPLAEEGGIVTEIIRHPFSMLAIDGSGNFCECSEDSTSLHPPDLRPTFSGLIKFDNVTISESLTLLDSATVTFINTLVQWLDGSSNVLLQVTADGYIIIGQDTPIDDSRLDPCEAAFYVDCTAGSPSLKIVIKDTNGDPYTITLGTSGGTDEKVKVSSNDTTAGYLNGKLVAGTGITFTENNDGGNETLTIALTAFSGARVYHASSQTVTSGSTTALALDTERYDTDAYHDAGANTKLTAPATATYAIGCTVEAGTSTVGTTGTWKVFLRLGGSTTLAVASQTYRDISTTMWVTVNTDYALSSTNYVEVVLTNNTNNTLTIGGVEMWIHKIK